MVANKWGNLKYVFLSVDMFSNGSFYMGRKPGATFQTAIKEKGVIMLQMDYLTALALKVGRGQRLGHWSVQGGG